MTARSEQGERNLATLLANLSPELLPGEFVFVALGAEACPDRLLQSAQAVVKEAEGLTLVLARHDAEDAGYAAAQPMRCITLNVHSSLEAVGLTAAVSTALAQAGISANIVAGYYHDHLYVTAASGQRALDVLNGLGA